MRNGLELVVRRDFTATISTTDKTTVSISSDEDADGNMRLAVSTTNDAETWASWVCMTDQQARRLAEMILDYLSCPHEEGARG
jgi:hypothetical protein